MDDMIFSMSYEQFCDYCNERSCDGDWSLWQAAICIAISEDINSIKVKFLGITLKNKTKQAREKAWRKFVQNYKNN